MAEEVNNSLGSMSSDICDKVNTKCSQKPTKFSIDSLLSSTAEKQSFSNVSHQTLTDNYFKTDTGQQNYFQFDKSKCGGIPTPSNVNEILKKENEVVSTTDDFFHRDYSEGMTLFNISGLVYNISIINNIKCKN